MYFQHKHEVRAAETVYCISACNSAKS